MTWTRKCCGLMNLSSGQWVMTEEITTRQGGAFDQECLYLLYSLAWPVAVDFVVNRVQIFHRATIFVSLFSTQGKLQALKRLLFGGGFERIGNMKPWWEPFQLKVEWSFSTSLSLSSNGPPWAMNQLTVRESKDVKIAQKVFTARGCHKETFLLDNPLYDKLPDVFVFARVICYIKGEGHMHVEGGGRGGVRVCVWMSVRGWLPAFAPLRDWIYQLEDVMSAEQMLSERGLPVCLSEMHT